MDSKLRAIVFSELKVTIPMESDSPLKKLAIGFRPPRKTAVQHASDFLPGCSPLSLDLAPFSQHPGDLFQSVQLGTKDDPPFAFKGEPDYTEDIQKQVGRKIDSQQGHRHVFEIGPNQVAVSMLNAKIAFPTRRS
jgi:hypothetical protein